MKDINKADKIRSKFRAGAGLTEETVREISAYKNEPEWMLRRRLESFAMLKNLKNPSWGPSLKGLRLEEIHYFSVPDAKSNAERWEEVPEEIKKTFEKLGIPEAERRALAGAGAQFDSQVIYHNLKEDLKKRGVIFEDMDVAVKKYPEMVQKYFMTTGVSPSLHRYAALHGAVWSGGTFIYVPPGVKVSMPLQAYFRMNTEGMGQFEHTLIIIDEGAECHYIEGCSAPIYQKSSLHAGCVEIFVKKGARMRYSSVENWSKNTYNLNTKRAVVEQDAVMEWVSGNLGSQATMLYPASVLIGRNARASHLSIAYAGRGQNQDTGAKVYHFAPNTSSTIRAKSLSKDGGVVSYRGLVVVKKGALETKSAVSCDALMFDDKSQSNTYPVIISEEKESDLVHEATVGRISEEQVFYLQTRGFGREQAVQLIVSGFIEPILKELPLEYAVEMNKLIELEIEGGLG